jgi:hypothetical protein
VSNLTCSSTVDVDNEYIFGVEYFPPVRPLSPTSVRLQEAAIKRKKREFKMLEKLKKME